MSDWEMTPMTDFAPFPEQETIDESNHNSVDSAEETPEETDLNINSDNEEPATDDAQTDNEEPTEEQEDG